MKRKYNFRTRAKGFDLSDYLRNNTSNAADNDLSTGDLSNGDLSNGDLSTGESSSSDVIESDASGIRRGRSIPKRLRDFVVSDDEPIIYNSKDDEPSAELTDKDSDDDFIVPDDDDRPPKSGLGILGSLGSSCYVSRILNYCVGQENDVKEVIGEIKKTYKLNKNEVDNLQKLLENLKNEAPSMKKIMNSKLPDKDKSRLVMDFCKMIDDLSNLNSYFDASKKINDKLEEYEKHLADVQNIEEKMLLTAKESIKRRIFSLDADDFTKSILLRWNEQSEHGDEEKWHERIEWALSLPYNRRMPMPIGPTSSCDLRAKYLSDARAKLDAKLFGMTSAKDKILHILNDRLMQPKMHDSAIAFVGPAGVGKCLAPDTAVMLASGEIRCAKEITAGDQLMGDDSLPRIVNSVTTGVDTMYTIYYCSCREFTANVARGDKYCSRCDFPIRSYTVNSEHIMVVLRKGTTIEIPMHKLYTCYKNYRGIRTQVQFNRSCSPELLEHTINGIIAGNLDTVPDAVMYSSVMIRLTFLAKLITECGHMETNHIRINVPDETIATAIVFIARSLAFHADYIAEQKSYRILLADVLEKRSDAYLIACRRYIEYGIYIVQKDRGEYCGFTIDGNRRFLLGDFTITHNTELARCLSDILKIPFEQISMGGITDVAALKGSNCVWKGSSPGMVVKALTRMKVNNGIIFFDEIDKIPNTYNTEGVVGTMLEIADPVQNKSFHDIFLDEIEINLSHLWFIYSLNSEMTMDKFLSDRLPKIIMPGYEVLEKIQIVKKYIFPAALTRRGLNSTDVIINDEVAKCIIVVYTKCEDKGVREVKHVVNVIAEKINMLKSVTQPDGTTGGFKLAYAIPNFKLPLILTTGIVHDLLADYDKKERPSYIV